MEIDDHVTRQYEFNTSLFFIAVSLCVCSIMGRGLRWLQFEYSALFLLPVIMIFSFAFELRVEDVRKVAPGVLWVTFIFAGMLGLGRSFVLEKDKGCLEGLLLCPVDRSAIYFGKMLGNVIFMTTVEAMILPIFNLGQTIQM